MKTNVLILVFAFIFSFNLNAQERLTLQRKGDVPTEKQLAKPNPENISQLHGKKLTQYLNLSEDQTKSVTSLIEKHLNADKYLKLIGSLNGNDVKTMTKSKNFEQDYVSSELFKDEAFTKDLSTVLDTKQLVMFRELINKELRPK